MSRYPKIVHLDTDDISNNKWLFAQDKINYKFYIQEKVDGSQLSFFKENNDILYYNKETKVDKTKKDFNASTTMLITLIDILNENYIYHGESICRIKHNVNNYKRTPSKFFIMFDIYDKVAKRYLDLKLFIEECNRIGLEYVQLLYCNDNPDIIPIDKCEEIMNLINENKIESSLGGKIEGMVIKNNVIENNKIISKKVKYVCKEFQERHKIKQRKVIRTPDEFLIELGNEFSTEARFIKATQHIKEKNLQINKENIKDEYINELDTDLLSEYAYILKLNLWCEFAPIIKIYARFGIGRWYNNLIKNEIYDNNIIPIYKNEKEGFLINLGLKYATSYRFKNIYDEVISNNKLLKDKAIINKLSEFSDRDIENNYKEELINILWDKFKKEIIINSRKDLEKWFSVNIII